jgi:hypothetical protein
MPQIKTSLKQLFGLFVQSAQDTNLDMPSRQLAARVTVLVAHIQRIEAKVDAVLAAGITLEKKVDTSLADIASQLVAIQGGAPAAPAVEGGNENGPMSEEDEAQAMADRVLAETEAEARGGGTPPGPIPTPSGNGSPAAVMPIRPAPVTQISPKPESAS